MYKYCKSPYAIIFTFFFLLLVFYAPKLSQRTETVADFVRNAAFLFTTFYWIPGFGRNLQHPKVISRTSMS